MADPIGAAGSIIGIVAFGMKLATTLQTYMELFSEAQDALYDIVFDVNATCSALKQLQSIIDDDRQGGGSSSIKVFKDDGVLEIEALAAKCNKVYQNIILLLQKASSSDLTAGIKKQKQPEPAALDPSSIKPMTLLGRLKWPWLVPRISRCHGDLRWLKISLLFNLQIANIAQWQLSGKRQVEISDQEVFIRQAAEKLRRRQNAMVREMVSRPKRSFKDEQEWEVEESSDDDPHNKNAYRGGQWHMTDLDETPNEWDSALGSTLCEDLSAEDDLSSLQDNGIQDSPYPSIQAFTEPAPRDFRGPESHKPTFKKASPRPYAEPWKMQKSLDQSEASRRPATKGSLSPVPQQVPDHLAHWAEQIFGSQHKYGKDAASQVLEAYIGEDGSAHRPIRIPFAQERLQHGLKKVLKDWRGSVWTKYIALSPEKRNDIDAIADVARKASGHERACVAFKEYTVKSSRHSFLVVFFALGKIHEPVVFIDVKGRRFIFPYEECRKQEGMEQLIRDAYESSPDHSVSLRKINNRWYDLADSAHNIILPSLWGAAIKPGAEIKMTLHPGLKSLPIDSSSDFRKERSRIRTPYLFNHDPCSRPYLENGDIDRRTYPRGSPLGAQSAVSATQQTCRQTASTDASAYARRNSSRRSNLAPLYSGRRERIVMGDRWSASRPVMSEDAARAHTESASVKRGSRQPSSYSTIYSKDRGVSARRNDHVEELLRGREEMEEMQRLTSPISELGKPALETESDALSVSTTDELRVEGNNKPLRRPSVEDEIEDDEKGIGFPDFPCYPPLEDFDNIGGDIIECIGADLSEVSLKDEQAHPQSPGFKPMDEDLLAQMEDDPALDFGDQEEVPPADAESEFVDGEDDELDLSVVDFGEEWAKGRVDIGRLLEQMTNAVDVDWAADTSTVYDSD